MNFSLQTPFADGIVELNGGVKVTTQIVPPCGINFDQLKIGQEVKLVFRKIQPACIPSYVNR